VEIVLNYVYGLYLSTKLGSYISARGGVVTAEEMAPFVVTSSSEAEDSADESYVLPAISRFAGEITIDDEVWGSIPLEIIIAKLLRPDLWNERHCLRHW
jgi:hypothetical protein